MEGFNYVDAIVAGVVVLSAILAYARGFLREVIAIAGWVVAGIAAFVFAPMVEPLISEVPVIGPWLAGSCEPRVIVAFAAVFALGLVILSLFTPLLPSAVQRSALGGLDRALGFLFGVVRGIVLVAVALVVLDLVVPGEALPDVESSRSAVAFASLQQGIEERIPQDAPTWIEERYQRLVGVCVA